MQVKATCLLEFCLGRSVQMAVVVETGVPPKWLALVHGKG